MIRRGHEVTAPAPPMGGRWISTTHGWSCDVPPECQVTSLVVVSSNTLCHATSRRNDNNSASCWASHLDEPWSQSQVQGTAQVKSTAASGPLAGFILPRALGARWLEYYCQPVCGNRVHSSSAGRRQIPRQAHTLQKIMISNRPHIHNGSGLPTPATDMVG